MKIFLAIIYWFLSLTWGSITTIIGFFGFLYFLIKGSNKIHRNGYSVIIETGGGNWGGLSLGAFAFCGNYSQINPVWFNHTRKHEFGHSLQNIILGPLFVFLVAIPSAIRYHYQIREIKRGTRFSSSWYDSVWFEGTATKYGTKAVEWIEQK